MAMERGLPIPPEHGAPALVRQVDEPEVLSRLTVRERRFVEEYPIDLNGRQAAIRAGYSEKSAGGMAYELLRKQHIVDALCAVFANRSDRTAFDRNWVLAKLGKVNQEAEGKDTAAHLAIRLKAVELIGKHVDVRAFRAGFGFPSNDDGDGEAQEWDMSQLTDEEFETFERLLAKVTVRLSNGASAGGAPAEEGPGPESGGPGGDSLDV